MHDSAPSLGSASLRITLSDLAQAAIAATVLGIVGCRDHASTEECRAAAEHYIDLAVREVPAHGTFSASQSAAVREVEEGLKRAEPAYRAVEDRCEALRASAVSCARDATSTKDWETCLHPSDGVR